MRAIRYILLGIILATGGGLAVSAARVVPYVVLNGCDLLVIDGSILVSTRQFLVDAELANPPEFGMGESAPENDWRLLPSIDAQGVEVPMWFILVFTIPPWFILQRRARELRRRERIGACRACGYDLTGNESGVCSECGDVVRCASI